MRATWFLLAALAAYAQQPAYEIRGVLLDKATNEPVHGTVIVEKDGTAAKITLGSPTHIVPEMWNRVETNVEGEFRVDGKGSGLYRISFGGDADHLGAWETVILTPADAKRDVRLMLDRTGEVTGRVLDDGDGRPLAGVPVRTVQTHWSQGNRYGTYPQESITSSDGTFHRKGGGRNPWVAAILPKLWSVDPQAPRTGVTTEEFQATDEDYEPSYWPGGARTLASALPAAFAPGQTIDIGTIRVRKMTYRRALVHVPPEYCGVTQLYRGELRRVGESLPDNRFDILCGRDILLKGLIPGEQYRFDVYPQSFSPMAPSVWPAKEVFEGVRTAAVNFTVGDRNPELTAILRSGADLEGRIQLVDGNGAKLTGKNLGVSGGFFYSQNVEADAAGRFRFINVPLGELKLYINGIVQQARLNGGELVGTEFEWTGQGMLEVTLDGEGATIEGIVAHDNKPLIQASVIVVRWPVSGNDISKVRAGASSGADGHYRLSPLPAGEYRVLALPLGLEAELDTPGSMERLLSRAEKVTLARGASVTLNLRPVEPR